MGFRSAALPKPGRHPRLQRRRHERHRMARHHRRYDQRPFDDLGDEWHAGLEPRPQPPFRVCLIRQWTIIGLGDFNGDGYADILWRDNSNTLAIWEMMGTQVLNPNATGVVKSPAGRYRHRRLQWRRHERPAVDGRNGNYAIWEMNGTTILNPSCERVSATSPAGRSSGRRLQRRRHERHAVDRRSGNYAIWEMNGTTVLNPSATGVAYVPTNWAVQLPARPIGCLTDCGRCFSERLEGKRTTLSWL